MLTPSILVIEDEYNLRQSLQLVLQAAGYTVRTLQNCSDAPCLFEFSDYSLIVLSLHNSNHFALDQIAKIRDTFPQIPILVLAANETTVFAGIKQGCTQDYLIKPVDPGQILAHINDILMK
ncbi:MAG TPA: response regulator [Anaerolineaceae bacterium]|nr:response regulator [Anaerolineaceae bacterium]